MGTTLTVKLRAIRRYTLQHRFEQKKWGIPKSLPNQIGRNLTGLSLARATQKGRATFIFEMCLPPDPKNNLTSTP